MLDYKYENGRRYHAYREGECECLPFFLPSFLPLSVVSYFNEFHLLGRPPPNDEREQDRLDLVHHVFLLVTGGELFRAPIAAAKSNRRILDLGTGTGIWALDVADAFPDATVIGNDLSAIQPGWVAPNCKFYIEDIEQEWTWSANEAFNLIHGRVLVGGISDWDRLYRQIYRHLKPGRWAVIQETDFWITSDDDTIQQAESINA